MKGNFFTLAVYTLRRMSSLRQEKRGCPSIELEAVTSASDRVVIYVW
jgi:hypothetical protein